MPFPTFRNDVEWDGNEVFIRDIKGLSPEVAATIGEVRKTAHGISIKLHNKIAALGELARCLNLYDHKVEVAANISIMITDNES